MASESAWLQSLKSSPQPGVGKTRKANISSFDGTYRYLLGAVAWSRLRPEVKRRFSVKPAPGSSITYTGHMQTVELSLMGWLFAQFCRLIGTPLTPYQGKNIPVTVTLTPDEELNGTAWHRSYDFVPDRRFTVRSTKFMAGDGSLKEHIGCGFSMRLELSEENGNLVFTSTAYELSLAGRTFVVPALLTPGVTTVKHAQIKGDRFRFSLAVVHPLLGRTIYQDGEFYSSDVSER